MRIIKSKN